MVGTDSPPGSHVMCDEEFNATSLSLLRQRVADCAAAAGLPQGRATDVTLAVHELAANAVTHGPGSGRLVIRASVGTLACQVTDAGSGAGSWPVQPGHGLWIVHRVADEVTVTSSPDDGSHVTAVFSSGPR